MSAEATELVISEFERSVLLEWLESRRYVLSGQHVAGWWSVHTGPNVVLGLGKSPIDALRNAYLYMAEPSA
jgi:hypothetical protein